MNEDKLNAAAKNVVKKYSVDVSDKLSNEAIYLRHIYDTNFETRLTPFNLLNVINVRKLGRPFPIICIALKIFWTLPVSVLNAERSLSALARIQILHRSCSSLVKISGLTIGRIIADVGFPFYF